MKPLLTERMKEVIVGQFRLARKQGITVHRSAKFRQSFCEASARLHAELRPVTLFIFR